VKQRTIIAIQAETEEAAPVVLSPVVAPAVDGVLVVCPEEDEAAVEATLTFKVVETPPEFWTPMTKVPGKAKSAGVKAMLTTLAELRDSHLKEEM